MNARIKIFPSIVTVALFFSGLLPAADEVSAAKDLTAVITLLGLPCGKVMSVIEKGKDDRMATCQDGNRYRVFLNAEGRVVAQKQ